MFVNAKPADECTAEKLVHAQSICRAKRSARTSCRRGLSLTEVVVSTMLVGIVMVGALATIGAVFRTQRTNENQYKSPVLAHHLMSEILQMAYEDPGGAPQFGREATEVAGTRADWNDVDDYDGWSATPPQTQDGSVLPNLDGWTRSVQVQYLLPGSAPVVTGSDQGLKLITVTVTDPAGKGTMLSAMRSRWGALEQPLGVDTILTTWVGVEVQVGSNGLLSPAGTNLVNHARNP